MASAFMMTTVFRTNYWLTALCFGQPQICGLGFGWQSGTINQPDLSCDFQPKTTTKTVPSLTIPLFLFSHLSFQGTGVWSARRQHYRTKAGSLDMSQSLELPPLRRAGMTAYIAFGFLVEFFFFFLKPMQ
jgi:hypothetical protein